MKTLLRSPFHRKATGLLVAIAALAGTAQAQILYVSVNGGGTIQQVSSTGVVSGFATGLTAPKGLAFGSNGNLYVAQDFSGTLTSIVSQVTSGGVVSTFATNLQLPIGIAFNSSGSLFVADYGSSKISSVSSAGGAVSQFATGSGFDVAFNSSGTLFVANRDSNSVFQVSTGGVVSAFASGFNQPNGLTFDSSGNLYVSNFGNNTVSKVTSGGVVSTFATGFSSPVGLAFNTVTGSLFVANQGANSISQVTSAGVVSTFATGISSGPQYLAFAPSAVPEPSTYAAIAGATMLGFAGWTRRRRKTSVATPVVEAVV